MRPTRVIAVGNAKEALIKLNEIVGVQKKAGKNNSTEIQMMNSIKGKIELVKSNLFYGTILRKV